MLLNMCQISHNNSCVILASVVSIAFIMSLQVVAVDLNTIVSWCCIVSKLLSEQDYC